MLTATTKGSNRTHGELKLLVAYLAKDSVTRI